MALFGSKEEKTALEKAVPEARAKAFAKLDLEKFLANEAISVDKPGDVDWEVAYTEDGVTATGCIQVPVEISFIPGDLENEATFDDLVCTEIKINGKKANKEEVEKADIAFDPLATIDKNRAEAQARKKLDL